MDYLCCYSFLDVYDDGRRPQGQGMELSGDTKPGMAPGGPSLEVATARELEYAAAGMELEMGLS